MVPKERVQEIFGSKNNKVQIAFTKRSTSISHLFTDKANVLLFTLYNGSPMAIFTTLLAPQTFQHLLAPLTLPSGTCIPIILPAS